MKIRVLLHNGKPLAESALTVEYIDEPFKGPSILPDDPDDKAIASFWVKFINKKGEEQEKAIEEAMEMLKILENQLKGKKFFGGDGIGLVDIVADFIGYWLGMLEEVMGIQPVTKEKFPKLSEWMNDFVNCNTVKECLLPRDFMLEFFQARYGKA